MAQNEVKFTVKIKDDGGLELVANKAKKTKKAIDDVSTSTDRASRARQRYNKGEKGVAGATANSTKAFSKMRDSMSGSSGLVGAYATLAANVFALTAAFGVLKRSAQVEQLKAGLVQLGSASGLAMKNLSQGLKEATGNAISLEEAMRATAQVTSAGLDPSSLERFGAAAKNISNALGRDVSDSFDRLTRGVTKLEPELLDELGLFIRVDEATEKYARSIGKTSSELTNFEKRLAFQNEALEQAEDKFGALSGIDSNPYAQLQSTLVELGQTIVSAVNGPLGKLVDFLSQNPAVLAGALLYFGGNVLKSAAGNLVNFNRSLEKSQKSLKSQGKALSKSNEDLKTRQSGQSEVFAKADKALSRNRANLKLLKDAQTSAGKSIAYHTGAIKANTEKFGANSAKVKESTQFLRNAQKRQYNYSKAITTTNMSLAKGNLQTALNALSQGKFKIALVKTKQAITRLNTAFKATTTQMKVATGGTAKLSAGLLVLRTAAGIATTAFITLGGAILAALNIIGLIIGAFFILKMVIEAVTKWWKGEEVVAYEEKLSDTKSTIEELSSSFEELDAYTQGTSRSIKTVAQAAEAQSNAFSTLLGEISKIESDPLSKPTDSIELFNSAIKESKGLQKALSEDLGYPVKQAEDIKGTEQERLDIIKETLDARLEEARRVKDLGDALLNLKDATADIFNDILPTTSVDNFVSSLESIKAKGEETLSKQIQETLGKDTAAQLSLKVMPSFEEFDKKMKDLKERYEKGDGNALKEVKDMGLDIPELTRVGSSSESKKVYDELTKAQNGLNEKRLEELKIASAAYQGSLRNANSLISAKQNELKLEQAKNLFTEENLNKQFKVQGEIADQQINKLSAEEKFTNELLRGINAQLELDGDNIENKKLQEYYQNRILELGEEQALITASRLNEEQKTVELAKLNLSNLQTQQKFEKAILDFQTKRLNVLEAIDKAQDTINKNALNLTAAQQGRGVTAEEEAKILEDTQVRDIKREGEKLDLRLKGIDLEYALLEAQYKLLKAEADLAIKQGKITPEIGKTITSALDDGIASIGKNKELAQDAAKKESEAAISNRVTETELAKEAARREKISAQLKSQQQSIDRLNALGREEAALSATRANLESQRAEKTAELEDIKAKSGETSNAYLLKQNELEEINNNLLENKLQILNNTASKMGELGGPLMGATAGFATSIAGQTEEGGVFAEGSDATMTEKLQFLRENSTAMFDELSKLGPEGELLSSIMQGSLAMADSWSTAFDTIKSAGIDSSEGMQAALTAVGQTISAISNMQQAQAKARVAGIDAEIAAEKNRDGKSQQSLAKIAALEKKKDAIKRKAFEQDKKMKMAQVVMSTASAIMSAITGPPGLPWSAVFGAMAAAMGAAQLAAISSSTYQGGAASAPSAGGGATSISIGKRQSSIDMASSRSASGELGYLRGQQGIGGPGNFKPSGAFYGRKMRAGGGETAGYIVGEQGPELFVPDRPGTVVPADETANMGAATNVTFSINAVDAEGVEQVLMGQRGNIIGMLREAANSYGQGFMEDIDTNIYNTNTGSVRTRRR